MAKSIDPSVAKAAIAAAKSSALPPSVVVEGNAVALTYADSDGYTARVSVDVEALRKLKGWMIASSEASVVEGLHVVKIALAESSPASK